MKKSDNLSFEERKELALEGRREGLNCAQAVIKAFPDVLHLPMNVALNLACGFGSGFGGLQKVCGVMSAMTILEGVRFEDCEMRKSGVYKVVRSLGNEFKDSMGSLECADIKGRETPIPCNDVIVKGIEIYHNYLNK